MFSTEFSPTFLAKTDFCCLETTKCFCWTKDEERELPVALVDCLWDVARESYINRFKKLGIGFLSDRCTSVRKILYHKRQLQKRMKISETRIYEGTSPGTE